MCFLNFAAVVAVACERFLAFAAKFFHFAAQATPFLFAQHKNADSARDRKRGNGDGAYGRHTLARLAWMKQHTIYLDFEFLYVKYPLFAFFHAIKAGLFS